MSKHPVVPLQDYREYPIDEMRQRVGEFHAEVERRRSVREFSDRPVPIDIIKTALKAANTAPSGANLQPWHFVVISGAATRRKSVRRRKLRSASSTRIGHQRNGSRRWSRWALMTVNRFSRPHRT